MALTADSPLRRVEHALGLGVISITLVALVALVGSGALRRAGEKDAPPSSPKQAAPEAASQDPMPGSTEEPAEEVLESPVEEASPWQRERAQGAVGDSAAEAPRQMLGNETLLTVVGGVGLVTLTLSILAWAHVFLRLRRDLQTKPPRTRLPDLSWSLLDVAKVVCWIVLLVLFAGLLMATGVVGQPDGLPGFLIAALLGHAAILSYMGFLLWVKAERREWYGMARLRAAQWFYWPLLGWLGFLPLLIAGGMAARVIYKLILPEQTAPAIPQPLLRALTAERTATELALFFLVVAVAAPVVEELLFRGMLYGALRRHMSWFMAALVSGLLFGAVHGVLAALPLALFGIYLAALRQWSGSLTLPIVVHALHNTVVMGLVLFSGALGTA